MFPRGFIERLTSRFQADRQRQAAKLEQVLQLREGMQRIRARRLERELAEPGWVELTGRRGDE